MTKAMLSRIPESLHARVKQESGKRGVSMSKIVEDALEQYLKSVFLAVHIDENPGQVTFTVRRSELHKLKSFEEVIKEVNEARLQDS